MSRREIPDWVQTVVTLALLVGVCWFLLRVGLEGNAPPVASPAGAPSPTEQKAGQKAASCTSSVVRCVASAEVAIEGIANEPCNPAKARQRLESDLHAPLESSGCRDAMTKLAMGCPPGCSLEPSNPLIVPGALDVHVDDAPNENGMCRATGTITVVLKGACAKK